MSHGYVGGKNLPGRGSNVAEPMHGLLGESKGLNVAVAKRRRGAGCRCREVKVRGGAG